MNLIILGDQYRKGLKSKGCAGLLKTKHNRCLIQDQYKIAKEHNVNLIYVCGFEKTKLLSYRDKHELDGDFIINDNYDKFNEVYGLSLIPPMEKDCIISFGYNYLHPSYFEPSEHSKIFCSKKSNSEIGCVVNDNKVEHLSFDLPNPIVNSYYISKKDMGLLAEILKSSDHHNCFLFEIINKMIDLGTYFVLESLNPKYHYEY